METQINETAREKRVKVAKDKLKAARIASTSTALKIVRKMLARDVAHSNKTRVADDIGLSWGCINNIVENITVEPRFSTILTIVRHYGLNLYVDD